MRVSSPDSAVAFVAASTEGGLGFVRPNSWLNSPGSELGAAGFASFGGISRIGGTEGIGLLDIGEAGVRANIWLNSPGSAIGLAAGGAGLLNSLVNSPGSCPLTGDGPEGAGGATGKGATEARNIFVKSPGSFAAGGGEDASGRSPAGAAGRIGAILGA